jgi:hypothetical protein
MRNVTISLESDMLARVKQHAAKKGVSVDALIKQLLNRELADAEQSWLEDFFEKADRIGLGSVDGVPLSREEIYDR